jgi:energy-coupling factor transporter ATP-binding protein EcfA2
MTSARITSVRFKNFKALRDFRLNLTDTNFLVGPNNAGKSTIIGAFRVLSVALRRMWHRKPDIVSGPRGRQYGIVIPADSLPISIENVHTDYADEDTTVSFRLSNGNELELFFPKDGSCLLIAEAQGTRLGSASSFRTAFPIELAVIPVLGPVEHAEKLVQEETVQNNVTTHRASRNFRSYWYHHTDDFDHFAATVSDTWPGMQVQRPFVANHATQELMMFCDENRIPRELFWVGSGFQIWCQLLTHLMRARESSLVVIDEPEVYLHADLQRQLVGLLRRFEADVLLATHSTEIMGEAEPSELVLIDKRNRSAERLKNVEKLQEALAEVGSVHNISLSRLARSRRIIFFEGDRDFKLVRLFSRQLGFDGIASGLEIFPAKSEGFGSWQKVSSLGWGISRALDNELAIGAVYDRDYYPDRQIAAVQSALNEGLRFSHVHLRKEIENYLLLPDALDRALSSAVKDKANREEKPVAQVEPVVGLLMEITDRHRMEVLSQRTGREIEYRKTEEGRKDTTTLQSDAIRRFEEAWRTLEGRLVLVPGKLVLAELRDALVARTASLSRMQRLSVACGAQRSPLISSSFSRRLKHFVRHPFADQGILEDKRKTQRGPSASSSRPQMWKTCQALPIRY